MRSIGEIIGPPPPELRARRAAEAAVKEKPLDPKARAALQFIGRAEKIQETTARKAGAVGYSLRALAWPHSDPDRKGRQEIWKHRRSAWTLMIRPGVTPKRRIGYPFGSWVRLLESWILTVARQTESPHIKLGKSQRAFLRAIGKGEGGRQIATLRKHLERLLWAGVELHQAQKFDGVEESRLTRLDMALDSRLWWSKEAGQESLFESEIILNPLFFEHVMRHAYPLDVRALAAFGKNSLAMDLYKDATYSANARREPFRLDYSRLAEAIGPDWAPGSHRVLKRRILEAFKRVQLVYPELNVRFDQRGILFLPSRPHVARLE